MEQKDNSKDILKQKFRVWTQKQVTLFANSKYALSFKPFMVAQGLAVLLVFVALGSFFVLHKNTTQPLAIQTAVTKKSSTIVANGNPVQWTALVKKSDITSGRYLLNLPKQAKNIKVESISQSKAQNILKQKPQEQLSLAQRQQLAYNTTKTNNFLAKVSSFLFADLSDAIDSIQDDTVVDLQSEASASAIGSPESMTPATEGFGEAKPATATETIAPPVEAEAASVDDFIVPKDVVKIDYETPAPVITEESTDKGKLVTVSSTSVECKRTSAPQENIVSMLSGSLFASLEDAVAPIVDSISNLISGDAPATSTAEPAASAEGSDVPKPEQPAPTYINEAEDLAYQECLSQQVPLTDVLASTKIPKMFKVGEEKKINIKWKNNGNQNMVFQAYDTDQDNYLDYVEWTVPHLSDQTFEIIFISKAFHLDSDKNIVADIYPEVQTKDNTYISIPVNNYVRVTFNQILDNAKDITIYARPTLGAPKGYIEVYPVYDDGSGNLSEGQKLDLVNDGTNPDFSNIDHDGKYRILLRNLQIPTDVFDIKIVQ